VRACGVGLRLAKTACREGIATIWITGERRLPLLSPSPACKLSRSSPGTASNMNLAIVRPARLSDCSELEGIQVRTSLMWPDFRRRMMDDPNWIAAPVDAIRTGRVLVVESRGETAGFAVLSRRADGDVEIDQYFLCPGHWGSEASAALFDGIAERMAQDGAWTIWATTTRAAAAFYEANGFVEDRKAPSRDEDEVRLQRRLHAFVGSA
jgi:hypothetical protein